MENRIRVLLLTLALTTTSGCASLQRLWPWHRHADAEVAAQKADAAADAATAAAEAAPPPTVIEPQVERRKIKVPKIAARNFEIGAKYGEISIESYTAAPVAGTVGTMMAMEAVKHLTGAGETYRGRLMVFDALYGETRVFQIEKRADCPSAWSHPGT